VHRGARSYRRTASRPASDGFVFGASRPPRLAEASERREHSGLDNPVAPLPWTTVSTCLRTTFPSSDARCRDPAAKPSGTHPNLGPRSCFPARPTLPSRFWPRKRAARALCAIRGRRRRRRPLRHRITQSRYRSPSTRGFSKGCDPDVCHRIVLATRSASTSCSLHVRASKTTSPFRVSQRTGFGFAPREALWLLERGAFSFRASSELAPFGGVQQRGVHPC